MNRKMKRILITFCMMLLCAMLPMSAQAASQKTKAMKAYKKFLTQKTILWDGASQKMKPSNCNFALAYIDNNSVPELVLYARKGAGHVTGLYALYTYRNGSVQYVGNMRDAFTYYKKKGVFKTYTLMYGEYTSYSKFSKGRATTVLTKASFGNSTTYTRYTNGNAKKLSKKAYNAQLKKLVGSKKESSLKFRKNNKANRSKYLK